MSNAAHAAALAAAPAAARATAPATVRKVVGFTTWASTYQIARLLRLCLPQISLYLYYSSLYVMCGAMFYSWCCCSRLCCRMSSSHATRRQ